MHLGRAANECPVPKAPFRWPWPFSRDLDPSSSERDTTLQASCRLPLGGGQPAQLETMLAFQADGVRPVLGRQRSAAVRARLGQRTLPRGEFAGGVIGAAVEDAA